MSSDTGKKPEHHKKHVARLEREQQQTRLILYIFFGILGVVVLLLVYGWLDVNYLQNKRPVAKINDETVLIKDFESRVRLRRQQLIDNYNKYQQYEQFFGMDLSAQLQGINTQLNTPLLIGEAVLDEMINEEVIRQEAAKRGITISEAELNAEIESAYGYFPNGTPTATLTVTAFVPPTDPAEMLQFITATSEATETPQATATVESTATALPQPTVEGATAEATATLAATATATATLEPTATATSEFTPTPAPTATAYTREGFDGVISDTAKNLAKFGFSADYYREFFSIQLLTEKLKEEVTADVQPVETQVRARHILVADEQVAKDIIVRLQAGEDFAEIARELSTDTGSATQGGDLGWFGKGAMVAEFETAVFALEKPGDFTTEPVQSNFGYHIIQLLAKQDRPLTAEELQTAKDAAFRTWLTDVRKEYTVETFDVWQSRVPTEPNFITAATEAASAGQTAQAEQLATLQAANKTAVP